MPVLAWDSGRNETVPFGNNRTIANFRRKYMEKKGLCDDRDKDIHKDDGENKVLNSSDSYSKMNEAYELAGEECWLLFVAFDILYVDGAKAAELLDETVSDCITPRPEPGSLMGLDGFERKKILHRVLKAQKHEVEIVQTYVVRPNGGYALGSDYFSATNPVMECGWPAYTLDSIECNLSASIPNLDSIHEERRKGRSDDQISQARAWAIDKIYKQAVEDQRMEGLVFKDLSAPYVLGDYSRGLKYWYKFKPDYGGNSVASDIDLVIVGSYFATGLRNAGKPSSYLCACVDQADNRAFFPVCKVNGGSMDVEKQNRLLDLTGFKLKYDDNGGSLDVGKWFREEDHGVSVPDFISHRNYKHDEEWRLGKDVYPDLWIHPDDSEVVTLNAGEIVDSDAFPAGLTLRFPRITKLREDGDSKKPHDIESDRSIWNKYNEVVQSRQGNDAIGSVVIGSHARASQDNASTGTCRFLTETQWAIKQKENKARKRGNSAPTRVKSVVENVPPASSVLQGLAFTVYEGRYSLRDNKIDEAAARAEGWYDEAASVTSSASVVRFIKKHGGTVRLTADHNCIVLGGRKDDDSVKTHVNAIERASSRSVTRAKMTQAQKKNAIMAAQEGVVRWTYVYSLVHSLLQKEEPHKESAKASDGPFNPKPTILDYLLRPVKHGQKRKRTADALCREDLSDHIMMWRAIDVIGQGNTLRDERSDDKTAEHNFDSWQDGAMKLLEPEDCWIMSCGHQTLWPYAANGVTDGKPVVLYPDTCSEGLVGSSLEARKRRARNDFLESCLPLARVMGAMISCSLDESVTHVLCDLANDRECIVFSDSVTARSFSDPELGHQLLDKLSLRRDPLSAATPVVLVSPTWIRKRKWTVATKEEP